MEFVDAMAQTMVKPRIIERKIVIIRDSTKKKGITISPHTNIPINCIFPRDSISFLEAIYKDAKREPTPIKDIIRPKVSLPIFKISFT